MYECKTNILQLKVFFKNEYILKIYTIFKKLKTVYKKLLKQLL